MKKLAFVVVALALSVLVIADQPPKGPHGGAGPAGKSNTAFLELLEKDPETWEIVEGGAWGKMQYNPVGSTCDFKMNGHGLEPDTDYTLIHYPEPQTTWPWPVNVLAQGTTNGGGNIHVEGSVDPQADSPVDNDADPPVGQKIWLVLTADINNDGELAGWNPAEYLFEQRLIGFDDTDVP